MDNLRFYMFVSLIILTFASLLFVSYYMKNILFKIYIKISEILSNHVYFITYAKQEWNKISYHNITLHYWVKDIHLVKKRMREHIEKNIEDNNPQAKMVITNVHYEKRNPLYILLWLYE